MGGIDVFADYDFTMKKAALVNHPSDLLEEKAVQNLVCRKLGLPEMEQLVVQTTD